MRNMFAKTFHELSRSDEKLCCVVADISPAGSIEAFRKEFPERFVNVGVSEQIMIGMCAGLAQEGFKPFAYTIATFALYRTFEFVRDDLAYQNLPVTIVGIGGGVVYSTLGATHHAMEDIAIATAIPNMQVLVPCDPLETEEATEWCAHQSGGPVYLRLGKAGEPNLTENAVDEFVPGLPRYISKGDDIAVVSCGPILYKAEEFANYLRGKGRSVSTISWHTLKPFDEGGALAILVNHKVVIVIEEMLESCGLGSKFRFVASKYGVTNTRRLLTFGLRDEFIHKYGSHDDVLTAHGLTIDNFKDNEYHIDNALKLCR